MKNHRRGFINRSSSLLAAGATIGVSSSSLLFPSQLAAADYRAVVVIFCDGGFDGNDMLVPFDGGYADYERARGTIRIPKESLVEMFGGYPGGRLALHPSLFKLNRIYNEKRLTWLANIGPLTRPMSPSQWRNREFKNTPLLLSHSDQVKIVQGWDAVGAVTGWGGRGLDMIPANLQNRLQAVSMSNESTLVTGRLRRFSRVNSSGGINWGNADFANPGDRWTQLIESLSELQFQNQFKTEYAKTLSSSFDENVLIAKLRAKSLTPAIQFRDERLSRDLAFLAQLIPAFRGEGLSRQLFLINWGKFDTHSKQRGDNQGLSLDIQLEYLSDALSSFDTALMNSGMSDKVLTVVMTEFGRTLQPAGSGTDHGWGNHWMVMGGMLDGGKVIGRVPQLVVGGVDDGDEFKKGRWVPEIASDQLAASVLDWLGIPTSNILQVLPNLINFQTPYIQKLLKT